jgi:hypothetical protein
MTAGLSKLLDRFRRRGPKHMLAADVEKIIHAYADAMLLRKSSFADASELPYPKATIKVALLTAILVTEDAAARELLKTNFVLLADWQEGVGPGAHAFELAMKEDDVMASARAAKAAGPSYTEILAKITSEMQALISELKSHGL